MATLRIEGGRRLSGTVAVEGNKNSALPLIAACLLSDEECVISNVPRIRDVEVLLEIIRRLGATVQGAGTPTLRITCGSITTERPDPVLVGKLRGSVLLLGPLLARRGAARLAPPGGDFPRGAASARTSRRSWRSAPCRSTSRGTRSMRRTG